MHARNREAHEHRATELRPRPRPPRSVAVLERQPQGHRRDADRDEDGEGHQNWVPARRGREAHRGHADVVHRGDPRAHYEAAHRRARQAETLAARHVEGHDRCQDSGEEG